MAKSRKSKAAEAVIQKQVRTLGYAAEVSYSARQGAKSTDSPQALKAGAAKAKAMGRATRALARKARKTK